MGSSDTYEINIKPFDMNKLKKESIVVCIGKRNTGKSFLIKDILYHKKDIPMGLVISRTDHLCHFYDKFIPSMVIHKEYSAEVVDKLFKRQETALNNVWNDPHCFLLFDDCLSDASAWSKDKRIKEIFFNGRHYKLLFLLTMQSPMGIPPNMRTNIDFTFILKNNNSSDREKIYKNYAGMFPTREIFEKVLDECTEDYHCLVINNTTNSNALEDQVFIYKATNHEEFKMFSDSVWNINNNKYENPSILHHKHNNKKEIIMKRNKRLIIKKPNE